MIVEVSQPRIDAVTLNKIIPGRVSYSIQSHPNGETPNGEHQEKLSLFFLKVNAAMDEAKAMTEKLASEKGLPIDWG